MSVRRAANRSEPSSARRLGLGLVEQGSTAALSFVLIAGASRLLSAKAFGAFALLNGTYVLMQTVEQALVSEAMIIAHSTPGAHRRRALAKSARLGLVISVAFGVLAVPISRLLGVGMGASALFGAVVLLALLADCTRGLLIATARARQAAVISTSGLLIVLPFLVVLPRGTTVLEWPLGVWALCYSPAFAYVFMWWLKVRPVDQDANGSLAAVALQSRVRKTLLAEAFLAGSAQYVALLTVDALVSREQAGALRLAISLLGPVSVMFNAVRLYGVAELQRAAHISNVRGLATSISLAMVVVAGFGWLIFRFIPETLGTQLMGATWSSAHSLIGWAALQRAAIGITIGFSVVLRALHRLKGPLRVRLVTSPLAIAGAFLGASVAGAAGALAGLSTAALLQAVGLLLVMRKGAR